jgi:hypothetical protein
MNVVGLLMRMIPEPNPLRKEAVFMLFKNREPRDFIINMATANA